MSPKSLDWFIERIGKRIYRNNNFCTCSVCVHSHKKGLIIADKLHANYLYDCQNDLQLIYEDVSIYQQKK